MPRLYKKESGALLGTISDADLKLLVDHLEEMEEGDDDYFIDGPTIDLLKDEGASPTLVNVLTAAVGNTEGVEIRVDA